MLLHRPSSQLRFVAARCCNASESAEFAELTSHGFLTLPQNTCRTRAHGATVRPARKSSSQEDGKHFTYKLVKSSAPDITCPTHANIQIPCISRLSDFQEPAVRGTLFSVLAHAHLRRLRKRRD